MGLGGLFVEFPVGRFFFCYAITDNFKAQYVCVGWEWEPLPPFQKIQRQQQKIPKFKYQTKIHKQKKNKSKNIPKSFFERISGFFLYLTGEKTWLPLVAWGINIPFVPVEGAEHQRRAVRSALEPWYVGEMEACRSWVLYIYGCFQK